MKSPFVFGSTVIDQSFTNRLNEIHRLTNNLNHGINTILISPRRWGKSSLVEKVTSSIRNQNKKIAIVHLDLFAIKSETEFLSEFARICIKAVSSKWQDWSRNAKDIFKNLIPRLVVNTEAGDFSLEFNPKDLIRYKDEILNLPESLAKSKKMNVIVCIDEFQNIRNYKEGIELEKSLRAYWQRHKHITYCLYGSKRHMMTEIFNASSNPFYRFGDIMFLGKINREEWIKFITKNFKIHKKSIASEQSNWIAEQMEDHPWYVQQLAHYTWVKTAKKVNEDILQSSLEDIINFQKPFFQSTIEGLSSTQLNLLKAIMASEEQLTSTKVMRHYGLGTPNNVRKNIGRLIHLDIIDKYEGSYIFLDPVFKKWMARTFG